MESLSVHSDADKPAEQRSVSLFWQTTKPPDFSGRDIFDAGAFRRGLRSAVASWVGERGKLTHRRHNAVRDPVSEPV
jgi:hypothetical protein